MLFVQNQIKYTFQNKKLLIQAFIKISPDTQNINFNNDTLEFYGDKILGFILSKMFCSGNSQISSNGNFRSSMTAGDLTLEYTKYSRNDYLAERIEKLRFQKFLIGRNGKQIKKISVKTEGDLFEAILGAVAVDSEWNVTILERVVERMLFADLSDNYSRDEIVSYSKDHNLGQIDFINQELGVEHTFIIRFSSLYKEFSATEKSIERAETTACRKALNYLDIVFFAERPMNKQAKDNLELLGQMNFIPMPVFSYSYQSEDDCDYWVSTCSIAGFDEIFEGRDSNGDKAANIAADKMLDFVFDMVPKQPRERISKVIAKTTEDISEDQIESSIEVDSVSQVYEKYNHKEILELQFRFEDLKDGIECIATVDGDEYRAESTTKKTAKRLVCKEILENMNSMYASYYVDA